MSYQIGNYIKVRGLEISKVKKISEDFVWFITQSGLHSGLPLADVGPLPLTLDIITSLGFKKIIETPRILHTEYSFEIEINSRFYYVKGVKYKNDYKWNILNLTLTHTHQLQNYFKLVDDKKELVLF